MAAAIVPGENKRTPRRTTDASLLEHALAKPSGKGGGPGGGGHGGALPADHAPAKPNGNGGGPGGGVLR